MFCLELADTEASDIKNLQAQITALAGSNGVNGGNAILEPDTIISSLIKILNNYIQLSDVRFLLSF